MPTIAPSPLARIYCWRIFSPAHSAWVHVKRSEAHGPGFWLTEARTQSGVPLRSRVINEKYAEDLYARYGSEAEVELFA